MLFLIYTSCRPAKLVDVTKEKAICCEKAYKDDNWDTGYNSSDVAIDDNPIYKNLEPWANPNDTNYNNDYDADTLT
jgi:hypothetical protein